MCVTVYQLLKPSVDVNPMENREWNSGRIVRDVVILKEKSRTPKAAITGKSKGKLEQWKGQNLGKKGIKLEEK